VDHCLLDAVEQPRLDSAGKYSQTTHKATFPSGRVGIVEPLTVTLELACPEARGTRDLSPPACGASHVDISVCGILLRYVTPSSQSAPEASRRLSAAFTDSGPMP